MKKFQPRHGLAAFVLLALSMSAQAHDGPPAPANVVQISATGQVEVAQDLLTMRLSTRREATDANTVQNQLKVALEQALAIARETARDDGVDEVCVIGGAQIYALALLKAKRLYISEVEAEPDGDARFPDFDESDWREISAQRIAPGEKDDHAFTFRILERL